MIFRMQHRSALSSNRPMQTAMLDERCAKADSTLDKVNVCVQYAAEDFGKN
jgi:hypothetical protein